MFVQKEETPVIIIDPDSPVKQSKAHEMTKELSKVESKIVNVA